MLLTYMMILWPYSHKSLNVKLINNVDNHSNSNSTKMWSVYGTLNNTLNKTAKFAVYFVHICSK